MIIIGKPCQRWGKRKSAPHENASKVEIQAGCRNMTRYQAEQTVSHILQDCPLLGQLRRTTWPEGATVQQNSGGAWGAAEDVPVCLVLGAASTLLQV